MSRTRSPTARRRSGWKRATLLALLLLLPGLVQSAAVLVIPSETTQPHLQVVDRLLQELSDTDLTTEVRPAKALTQQLLQQYQLLVPLGTAALEAVQALETRTPTLAVMIPKDNFELLSAPEPARMARQQGQLSAIFLEQPYWRQLQLIRAIQPEGRSLGVLLGPHSRRDAPLLRRTIERYGWQPQLEVLETEDNPLRRIAPLVEQSDLILALPDRADFNRNTAKWLLLLSLRQRIPLVAYSSRYVEAGAIAAVFSSPESIAAETASRIRAWQQQSYAQLAAPGYPTRFTLRLNAEIAARLGISLPTTVELEQALREESQP